MGDPVRNRCDPASLTDVLVDAAVERIEADDTERGRDVRHVYDTLTWGEGPGKLTQSGVQDWLWYRLPTKYMTDEVGYTGRLAGIAAELFDELGLDAYAAICRSETTVGVHDAFDHSDKAGFDAMRTAQAASGIDPPDLDDFEWGAVMGIEEPFPMRDIPRTESDAITLTRIRAMLEAERSVFVPASERLPDFLPDPVKVGGTGRDETAPPKDETPGNTARKRTRRHRPGRGSSDS